MASRFLLVLLLALSPLLLAATDNPDLYQQAMQKAEEAKAKRDYPAMASAIRLALKYGPGKEYDWRSLAWSLHHAGQWQDSLGVAQENVKRNGVTGWSLEQLAESQMGVGDWGGARDTLRRIDALSPEDLGTAQGAIDDTRRRLLDLTGQRRYELTWKIDMKQGGPDKPARRLLMPRLQDPRQTVEFTVENVLQWEKVSEGPRDFIDVVKKPGEPFVIKAQVTIRGYALGYAKLESLSSPAFPKELQDCLGPFQHCATFDPASPLVSRIAGMCRSTTPARTVQNLLNWLRDNMHYEDTKSSTPEEILAGGQGVCHHYCSTFTVLCRAAGLPAQVAHGLVLKGEGEFTNNHGSHGWASVYLDPLGWVPVDPLDANSLALFGRSNYLLTDYANATADDNHFAYHSIQGYQCDGKVVAIEPQP